MTDPSATTSPPALDVVAEATAAFTRTEAMIKQLDSEAKGLRMREATLVTRMDQLTTEYQKDADELAQLRSDLNVKIKSGDALSDVLDRLDETLTAHGVERPKP